MSTFSRPTYLLFFFLSLRLHLLSVLSKPGIALPGLSPPASILSYHPPTLQTKYLTFHRGLCVSTQSPPHDFFPGPHSLVWESTIFPPESFSCPRPSFSSPFFVSSTSLLFPSRGIACCLVTPHSFSDLIQSPPAPTYPSVYRELVASLPALPMSSL